MLELSINNATIVDIVITSGGFSIVRMVQSWDREFKHDCVDLILTDHSMISGEKRPAIKIGDKVNARVTGWKRILIPLKGGSNRDVLTAQPLSIELIE